MHMPLLSLTLIISSHSLFFSPTLSRLLFSRISLSHYSSFYLWHGPQLQTDFKRVSFLVLVSTLTMVTLNFPYARSLCSFSISTSVLRLFLFLSFFFSRSIILFVFSLSLFLLLFSYFSVCPSSFSLSLFLFFSFYRSLFIFSFSRCHFLFLTFVIFLFSLSLLLSFSLLSSISFYVFSLVLSFFFFSFSRSLILCVLCLSSISLRLSLVVFSLKIFVEVHMSSLVSMEYDENSSSDSSPLVVVQEQKNHDCKLFVGNVPTDCTEDKLHQLLSAIGKIGELSLLKKGDGTSKVSALLPLVIFISVTYPLTFSPGNGLCDILSWCGRL